MQRRLKRTVTQRRGHGLSDPPAKGYSLGAHAPAMRDLLVTLGHARTRTVIHRRGQTVGAGKQISSSDHQVRH
ncbi:hypothetical protein ACTXG5_25710 [Mycobacterium sp. Dal123C01]|uniref:hypothetical protein n=1 Tax=Mycobacterium sp. Dal123C01 TaxID=3457577 RepID=UPI00403E8D1A